MAQDVVETKAPVRLDDTNRLEAFSDGVFGVAITLLVLNIQVPHLPDSQDNNSLFQALLTQWPVYLGYITSFFTVGVVWANHHTTFGMIRYSDHGLRIVNLFLLMAVTLIPFTTALLAEYIQVPTVQRTAAAVYSSGWLLLAITYYWLWRYAATHRLLEPSLTDEMVSTTTRRNSFGIFLYVAALVAALISAPVSVLICIGLALYYLRNPAGSPARKLR